MDPQSSNPISERYSGGDYLEKNATWHAEDSPWKARNVAQILEDNGLSPQDIAEVGCGAGDILINLKRRYGDRQFRGYELSPLAYDICKAKSGSGVDFHNANIIELPVHFDLLLCMDVFEHVDDYIGFLRSIRPKADHHVFHIPLEISVKTILMNSLIQARNTVGHLHYFTAETAIETLRDAGYHIVASRFTAPFEPGGVAPVTLKQKIATYSRRFLYKISPSLLSRTVGGCSLLVLCRPAADGNDPAIAGTPAHH